MTYPAATENTTALVLSRKPGEKIVIGDEVVIQVVEVRQGKVRLRVVAPRHVVIDREEVRSRRDRQFGSL